MTSKKFEEQNQELLREKPKQEKWEQERKTKNR